MSLVAADAARKNAHVQLAVFRIADASYAVDIMRVREVLRLLPIVAVHDAPPHIEGVIALRGAYIPVVSTRRRLGLGAARPANARILIVTVGARIWGLLIDSMSEVMRVARADLQKTPLSRMDGRSALIAGMCEVRGRVLQLLNVNALLDCIEQDGAFEPAAAK